MPSSHRFFIKACGIHYFGSNGSKETGTLQTLPSSYEAVQAFIKRAAELIPDVQVSAVNGLEGVDVVGCREITEELGAQFKQRELDVVG